MNYKKRLLIKCIGWEQKLVKFIKKAFFVVIYEKEEENYLNERKADFLIITVIFIDVCLKCLMNNCF